MSTAKVVIAAVCLLASEILSATGVSVLSVRQRWPFDGMIDIDFVVTGSKTDVDFFATWDGQTTPVYLCSEYECAETEKPKRISLNPAGLPELCGKSLRNFSVTASVVDASAHKYLVVNLKDGGVSFLSEVPQGGWPSDYKSTKMVFARIPAGAGVIGDSKAELDYVNGSSADSTFVTAYAEREVSYTSDFYVGVFKFTNAQYEQLVNGKPNADYASKKISYYDLRGSTNADENANIDWPATKYKVGPDSVVAKLRAKSNGLIVDLCEEEQWEYAARCQATTIWPNGGTTSESFSILSNYVNAIAAWWGSGYGKGRRTDYSVGQMAPNGWGLYDICGCGGEWTLNCAPQRNSSSTTPRYGRSAAVDTVGPLHTKGYDDYDARRIMKGSGGAYESAKLWTMLVSARQLQDPASNSAAGTRFCIHLRSLNFDEHK